MTVEDAFDTTNGAYGWTSSSIRACPAHTSATPAGERVPKGTPERLYGTASAEVRQPAAGDVSPSVITVVALLEALALILLICAVWPQ
jgi:hypothetical protein